MTTPWTCLPDVDTTPVDKLMIAPNGLLRVVPAAALHEFPLATQQLWCVRRGVYQYPTEELLDWLSERIAGRAAIEVCAGNGVLGRNLGIPTTDSWMQARPEIAAYYLLLGQHPITPPPDVLEFDAAEAVERYRPDVVIGSWVTQLWRPGDVQASTDGVDELAILDRAAYIHIGNDSSHGRKRALRRPHTCHRFPWLVSRGQDQTLNHIREWPPEEDAPHDA